MARAVTTAHAGRRDPHIVRKHHNIHEEDPSIHREPSNGWFRLRPDDDLHSTIKDPSPNVVTSGQNNVLEASLFPGSDMACR
jgi:hypothetical protein